MAAVGIVSGTVNQVIKELPNYPRDPSGLSRHKPKWHDHTKGQGAKIVIETHVLRLATTNLVYNLTASQSNLAIGRPILPMNL